MLALINRVLDWLKSLLWKEEMELTLVGLQNSGKTTFVNVIAVGCLYFVLIIIEMMERERERERARVALSRNGHHLARKSGVYAISFSSLCDLSLSFF